MKKTSELGLLYPLWALGTKQDDLLQKLETALRAYRDKKGEPHGLQLRAESVPAGTSLPPKISGVPVHILKAGLQVGHVFVYIEQNTPQRHQTRMTI